MKFLTPGKSPSNFVNLSSLPVCISHSIVVYIKKIHTEIEVFATEETIWLSESAMRDAHIN